MAGTNRGGIMNWESILNVITHPIIITVVTAVAGVAINGFRKYKKAFNELVDIPRAVLKARTDKSPGGKTITTDEYAKIGKEIVEFVEQAGKIIPRK